MPTNSQNSSQSESSGCGCFSIILIALILGFAIRIFGWASGLY